MGGQEDPHLLGWESPGMAWHLPCGFGGKKQARPTQTQDQPDLASSGPERLPLLVWHLALEWLMQVNGVLKCEGGGWDVDFSGYLNRETSL